MKTAFEADREGNPVRVYHATKTRAWTHPLEERPDCVACQEGRLPDKIKEGGKR